MSLVLNWSVFPTQESSHPLFKGYWQLFRCALVGHTIVVLRNQSPMELLYVLDVNRRVWQEILLGGDLPVNITGNSLVLVKDTLFSIGNGAKGTQRLNHMNCLDIPLYRWERKEVSGEDIFPYRYHAADYWESQKRILINTRQNHGGADLAYNFTYSLNPESGRATKVKAKGNPPSMRNYHSSYFFDDRELWFICGGDSENGMRNDICLLDFATAIPTWTTVAPFSRGVGISVTSLAVTQGSKVLIIGGVRNQLARNVVATYDVNTREVNEEGLAFEGTPPATLQFTFPKVVQRSSEEFFFLASDKALPSRCYRITVQCR